jgi:UTP--glucose-1-phosphate uridylyltransferase
VAVILPDDLIVASVPVLSQMSAAYDPGLAYHMVAAMKVDAEDTASYGILEADMPAPGRYVPVHGLVEKPSPEEAPSNLAIVGRYILHPRIFDTLLATGPGSGGEIQLTDAIARDVRRMGVAAFRFDGVRFDCGQPDGLVEAGAAFQDVEDLMRAGPTA